MPTSMFGEGWGLDILSNGFGKVQLGPDSYWEADESTFWLDIIPETKNANIEFVDPLLKEARELTAIFTASNKAAKENRGRAGKTEITKI